MGRINERLLLHRSSFDVSRFRMRYFCMRILSFAPNIKVIDAILILWDRENREFHGNLVCIF